MIYPIKRYDNRGNHTFESPSPGVFCHWEYNDKNQMIKQYSHDNHWITFDYDANGNLTRQSDSEGQWMTQQFNDNNDIIHYQDSYDYWKRHTYDGKLNTLICDSKGLIEARVFDKKGRCINYSHSSGSWVNKEYAEDTNIILKEERFSQSIHKVIFRNSNNRVVEIVDKRNGKDVLFSYINDTDKKVEIHKIKKAGYDAELHYDFTGKLIYLMQNFQNEKFNLKNWFSQEKLVTYEDSNGNYWDEGMETPFPDFKTPTHKLHFKTNNIEAHEQYIEQWD
tara:strand:+ start:2775 stop:3611 length:837 start_codon:yes stop_codon:yes gene_type:complete